MSVFRARFYLLAIEYQWFYFSAFIDLLFLSWLISPSSLISYFTFSFGALNITMTR